MVRVGWINVFVVGRSSEEYEIVLSNRGDAIPRKSEPWCSSKRDSELQDVLGKSSIYRSRLGESVARSLHEYSRKSRAPH